MINKERKRNLKKILIRKIALYRKKYEIVLLLLLLLFLLRNWGFFYSFNERITRKKNMQ